MWIILIIPYELNLNLNIIFFKIIKIVNPPPPPPQPPQKKIINIERSVGEEHYQRDNNSVRVMTCKDNWEMQLDN